MHRELTLLGVLLANFYGAVWSSNINIDDTCTIGSGCMLCMSRRSADLERCQQLYFYITYSTGDSLTKSNKAEIDRYCNGDCPIVLATANFYCASATNISDLLAMCPSYSVNPTGSFNVNSGLAANCLRFSSPRCLQCIGESTKEATRCLQLYLLATNPNTSSTYSSSYCEDNCPLTLDSFSWYCGAGISDAYSYCERNSNGEYCGYLRYQSTSDFNAAAENCNTNYCGRNECVAAINKYGCCLRHGLSGQCTNILDSCNFPVVAATMNIQVDSSCLVTSCPSCLSRDTDELERCEQIYSYLAAAQGKQANQTVSIKQEFCTGNCPILLLTSDQYCGVRNRQSLLWQLCPSYNRIPSASVDIQASYGNIFSCSVRESCEECIGSRSPEATRCLQLYLLREHPNMTNFYVDEYCKGNCPLTLSTSEWYCNGIDVEALFDVCRRTDNDLFCETLSKEDTFEGAVYDCWNNCSSSACLDAQRVYRCCLNGRVPSECIVPTCAVLTAHAPPTNVAPYLLIIIFNAFVYHIINI